MAWNPTKYFEVGCSYDGLATLWSHVDNFCDEYVETCYFFKSTAQGNGIVQHNNAVAIKLLINKCNSLQEQVDALSGGEVDMPSILSAMLAAEYEELQEFIGIVDAYRVALWNQWFNAEYYAALARGFLEVAP